MTKIKSINHKLRWAFFWALTATFIMVVLFLLNPAVRNNIVTTPVLILIGTLLLLLGGAIIYLTIEEKLTGLPMIFMLLTGTSASGITICVLLHSAIYGLFIYWFGSGFWSGIGLSDEPLFFFLGLIFFPVALLAGIIGNIVLLLKKGKQKKA